MYKVNINTVDRFVDSQREMGTDVFWDNYTLVFFRPDERGIYARSGAFRNGQWGYANRFDVTPEGTWNIDVRNIRRPSKSKR